MDISITASSGGRLRAPIKSGQSALQNSGSPSADSELVDVPSQSKYLLVGSRLLGMSRSATPIETPQSPNTLLARRLSRLDHLYLYDGRLLPRASS